jgi:large subunit ribosomal protein L22
VAANVVENRGHSEVVVQNSGFFAVRGVDGSHEETVVMISNAKANFQRISPRKARMIVNLIRGRDASDALQLLDFTFKAGAPFVKKLIASAVANARLKRPDVDADALFISKASVDKAGNQNLRRWRPRAQGRATRIAKGVSHIHIELDQR